VEQTFVFDSTRKMNQEEMEKAGDRQE